MTEAVDFISIHTTFHAVVDSSLEMFNRARPRPEFRIDGMDSAEAICIKPCTCIEVTVLTIHAVRMFIDFSLRTKIFSGVGYKHPSVANKISVFVMGQGRSIGSRPVGFE